MPSLNHTIGKKYWRSLDELADTPEFRSFVESEFPNHAGDLLREPQTRRHFLKIMGASFGLAGLTGCRRWPQEKLAPFAHRPESRIPGKPQYYATAMEVAGVASPLVVTSYDGRPIKIEGNPEHPASGGAASVASQASILTLYDPDRSKYPLESDPQGRESVLNWDQVGQLLRRQFDAAGQGERVAVLSGAISSPSGLAMRKRFLERFPQARWFEYEPIHRDNMIEGARLAFGQPLRAQLHLDKAEVIVTLGEDLIGRHPNAIQHAGQWAAGRRSADQGKMNRMYVAESTYTISGAVADHRLAIPEKQIALLVRELSGRLNGDAIQSVDPEDPRSVFLAALAKDLQQHTGRCVVVAGPQQPPEVHAAICALNHQLGNIGQTITFTREPGSDASQTSDDEKINNHWQSIQSLTQAMRDGQIETLLIADCNPVYTAPADLNFASALAKVPNTIHTGLYRDETARRCRWHLPQAHYLESWGDARTWDGTVSVIQPLIRPLYEGRTLIELLAVICEDEQQEGYDIVRRTFADLLGEDQFEQRWRRVLHEGIQEDSGYEPVAVDLSSGSAILDNLPISRPAEGELEVNFIADSKVHDGRFANNGWIQELPDAMSQITWDNAALISLSDAQRLGLKSNDMIAIEIGNRKLEIAAYVMPGQAPGSITLPLGYGRSGVGNVSENVGFNTYTLRTTAQPYVATGAKISSLNRTYTLASAQDHHAIDPVGFEGRKQRVGQLVRETTLEHYRSHPEFVEEKVHSLPLIQPWEPPVEYDGHRWGMAINLNSCIGCNACVVACQAENNIPIVGKEQVLVGREMHWIRLDRYFKGEPDDPSPECVHQPMTCHHCENAPCESVCPVAATVHDTEGLNTMVYNRCIGTRYCSNNCPYKVRRFNYFDWHSKDPRGNARPWFGMPDSQSPESVSPIKEMVFNPEVTVRMRGVMEKCTYCVQRIQAVKIDARNEQRPIEDGEVTPACAQTCPTRAIVFGDLNDPASEVRRLQEHNRSYFVLEELNVRPRTSYLGRVRNPAQVAAATLPDDHAHRDSPDDQGEAS